MMKNKHICLSLLGAGLLLLASCAKDTEQFDNKVYISNDAAVENLLLKGVDEATGTIQTRLAQPATEKVSVTYRVAPEMLRTFEQAYYQTGLTILPEENYELPNTQSEIAVGGVRGTDVTVKFKSLTSLDREKVYLLPLTIAQSNSPVLGSGRTHYFVIKGAALINSVANVASNKLTFADKTKSRSPLSNLSQLTAEALIRVDKFGKLISTIMGVEGEFLIRIGDAGVDDNQIQLATNSGNVTDPSWTLKTNEWTHVALTYDAESGKVALYLNGVKKGDDQYIPSGNPIADWSGTDFWVGYSYSDDRYLDGDIVECRIWNRVLTEAEIQAKDHFYNVATDAEGLVAYWKFDEGQGSTVKDHTSNANNLLSASPLKWKVVELPAK